MFFSNTCWTQLLAPLEILSKISLKHIPIHIPNFEHSRVIMKMTLSRHGFLFQRNINGRENKDHNSLKGIVHPKMKIVSSFTHPQVGPNLYECLCSAEHKGRYSEEYGIQKFWGTIDFHCICFSYYGSQWCPKTAWLQTFFKNLPLCSAEQRN